MAEALPNGIALALQLRDPRLAQCAPCMDDPLAPLPEATSTAGSSSGAAGSAHLHVAAPTTGRAGNVHGAKRRRQGKRGAPAAQSVLPTYGARSWPKALEGLVMIYRICSMSSAFLTGGAAFNCIPGTGVRSAASYRCA